MSTTLPSPSAPYYGKPDDTRTTQTSASVPLMQNEPAIAINPKKPSNMIVGYNDYSPLPGSCPRAHYSVTTNGITWTSGTPLPTTGLIASPCTNQNTPTGTVCCDPAIAFDSIGDAFFATMTWNNQVLLYTSTPDGSGNAGGSWHGPYLVGGGGAEFGIDKPAIAVDTTGGPRNGTIYIAWVDYYTGGASLPDCNGVSRTTGDRIFVRAATINAGGFPTFSGSSVQASDPASPFNWGPAITVGPSGSLYVTYLRMPNICIPSANSVMISRSDDGAGSFALRGQVVDSGLVSPSVPSGNGRFDSFGDRASAFPTITTTSNGTVFIAWTDGGAGNMDIQSRASITSGATWEARVRVNDIATNDQFLPVAVTVPGDTIDVFYYSRQADTSNVRGGLYTVSSLNGGASFSADVAYSSTFSNPNVCSMNGWMPCLWGDYIGAASYGSGLSYGACAVWADGRDSAMIGDNDVNTYIKCTHNNIFYAVGSYSWLIQRPPVTAYVPFSICILFPQLCITRWQAEILPTHSTSGTVSVSLSANNLPTGVTVGFSPGVGYPPFNSTISVDFSKAQCSDPTSCLQGINITATDGTNSTQIDTSEVLSKVPYLLTDTSVYNPGETVNLTGFQFTANSTATVKLDGSIIGNPSTDKAGSFITLVKLPSSITNGVHTLSATDSKSLTAAATISTPKIQIEADSGKKTVVSPSTGLSPIATMLLLLTIGVMAILPMRRRARTKVSATPGI